MKLEYDRSSVSSNKDYNTPPKYLEVVREFIGGRISLDPCSNESSMVDADTEWYLPDHDGLRNEWKDFGSIFVNPPYGKDSERGTSIRDWCRKCAETSEANHSSHIFLLIPVATNTRHWKESIFPWAQDICFLSDTRVKFWENGMENDKGSPMACCIVHYGGKCNGRSFRDYFTKLGFCIRLDNPHTWAIKRFEAMDWMARQVEIKIPVNAEAFAEMGVVKDYYGRKTWPISNAGDALAYAMLVH